MHSSKTFPSQDIHIICQLFGISSPLHKGNHAAASLAIFIHQRTQFFPYRVFPAPLRSIRIGAENIQPDLFRHLRGGNKNLFRRQISRCPFQRFYGCRQADALQGLPAQLVQPCQGKHQMGASFRINQGMQFVQNYRLCRGQYILPGFAGEHQI